MKKKEFMEELKEALAGRVPTEVYYDTVQYYEDYFKQQIAEGKNEEQITASLGSARIVAKTIIETSGGSGDQFYEMPEDRKRKTDKRNEDGNKYEKGWHLNVDENGYTSLAFGRIDFGTVLGKVVAAIAFLIIAAIVVFLIVIGINILFYLVIPVVLILLVIYLIVSAIDKK